MSTPALTAWIDGIGLIAPGLPDWPSAAAVLRGEQPYVAAPSVLPVPAWPPPAERRRASRIVKLVLAHTAFCVPFAFLPGPALGAAFVALALTLIFGLAGTWRVLGQKAAPVLRNL